MGDEAQPHRVRAINHQAGNLQLTSCAGPGIKPVVARRIANLLKAGPNAPQPPNINAFSFTKKAPAELKERTVERCGPVPPRKGAT